MKTTVQLAIALSIIVSMQPHKLTCMDNAPKQHKKNGPKDLVTNLALAKEAFLQGKYRYVEQLIKITDKNKRAINTTLHFQVTYVRALASLKLGNYKQADNLHQELTSIHKQFTAKSSLTTQELLHASGLLDHFAGLIAHHQDNNLEARSQLLSALNIFFTSKELAQTTATLGTISILLQNYARDFFWSDQDKKFIGTLHEHLLTYQNYESHPLVTGALLLGVACGYKIFNQPTELLQTLEKALTIAHKHNSNEYLGQLYCLLGDLESSKALQYLKKALYYAQETENFALQNTIKQKIKEYDDMVKSDLSDLLLSYNPLEDPQI